MSNISFKISFRLFPIDNLFDSIGDDNLNLRFITFSICGAIIIHFNKFSWLLPS